MSDNKKEVEGMKTEKECFFCGGAATHEYLLPFHGALKACDDCDENAKKHVRHLSGLDGSVPDRPKVPGIEEVVGKKEKVCHFCKTVSKKGGAWVHTFVMSFTDDIDACTSCADTHFVAAVDLRGLVMRENVATIQDRPKVPGIEEAVDKMVGGVEDVKTEKEILEPMDKMVTRYCCDCANMVGGGDCRTTFPRLFHPDRDFIISCEKARLDERFCGLLGRNFKLVDK